MENVGHPLDSHYKNYRQTFAFEVTHPSLSFSSCKIGATCLNRAGQCEYIVTLLCTDFQSFTSRLCNSLGFYIFYTMVLDLANSEIATSPVNSM